MTKKLQSKQEDWEKEFDDKFIDKVKDINGGTAYLEWQAYQEEELIELIKSFIRNLIAKKRKK